MHPSMTVDTEPGTPVPGESALCGDARRAIDMAIAGEVKNGLQLAVLTRTKARERKDATAELMALNAAARCHNIRNDAIATFTAGMDAVELALHIGDRRGLAHALCTIAYTTIDLQLAEHTTSLAECAVADAKALQDPELEFRARQVFGVMLGDLNRFDEARQQFEWARQATAAMSNSSSFGYRIEWNLALLNRKEAAYCHARGALVEMQAACERVMKHSAAALARAGATRSATLEVGLALARGGVQALRGDLPTAIGETEAAISLAARGKLLGPIPAASLRLAEFHRAAGQLQKVSAVLSEGLRIAQSLRPNAHVGALCDALAEAARVDGNALEARRWERSAEEERSTFRKEQDMARDYLWKLRAQVIPGAA